MKNNTQKIYVFDVGNTLIEKPSNFMVSELVSDLVTLQKNGNLIGIATMRNLTMLKDLITQVKFDFIIALNGAYVVCGNEILIDYPININELSQIRNTLDHLQMDYKLFTKDTIQTSKEFNEIVYGIEIKNCHNVIYDLERKYPSFTFHIWEKGKTCDVHSINVSKSKGMEIVCNYFDISLQKSIAFGDGFNDVELFKVTRLSVAMDTAPEELKNIASFITKSVTENGVSWALKNILV